MADREKVIRAVETCFDSWIDKHRNMGLDLHEVERLKREAMEMLKEQEPVKPQKMLDGSWSYERCGACGNVLYERGFVYCPWCGRKVKRNETN